jgi:hypothetical protein
MDANSPVLADAARRCRPLLAVAGLLAVALGLAWLTTPPRPVSPVGLWDVSDRQWWAVNADVLPRNAFWSWLVPRKATGATRGIRRGPGAFWFDGETVSFRSYRMRPWEVGPADNIWRLPARREGTDLYCVWPCGWSGKVATFVDGHFQIEQGGIRWVLAKADPDNLRPSLQPLLKKDRPVWHDTRSVHFDD